MKNYRFRTALSVSLIGLVLAFGAASVTNAQNDRRDDRNRTDDRRDNDNNNQGHRYRVRHGNYQTDDRGVEVLRQAVNQGYQAGFQAGQQDRSSRRRNNSWRNNQTYRTADMGYDSHVDRSQYQYYFQQGFQKGYDDGYNSRNRYGQNNSVLGTFLNQILNPRPY